MDVKVKPRNLPADQRRAVTVEAVVELTAEQNPGDITTAAIAKRMNLTQGALFRHFPSKDAIWQAVMEWVAERLLQRVDRAIQGAASPLHALEAVFMTHIEFVVAHPGVPRLLFGELQRAEDTPAKRMARTLMSAYRKRLSGLIDAAKLRGEVAREIDTAAASLSFIGSIQGLVMQSLLSGRTAQMRADAPVVFAIYRRGIRSVI
ncbi:MAG: TetR family transcriptional regulator [Rhodocyclaceae bacterium]|nr:MAG: TetR family transcriptional regulator [Rhodocyclaceae bacterium]TND06161.1 MAG: TetR family transcriptional regulator [Rhodocyclaceae bacterium]